MYKCQNKVIFFNGKSDITLEINGENIVAVFIQKSIAILELKEKKFVYFYHTTDEQNKQGHGHFRHQVEGYSSKISKNLEP